MIHARRPDIVLVKKKGKECMIIDVAVPADSQTWSKEEEKIDKYTGTQEDIESTTRQKDFLAEMGIHVSFETIQKASLLGTAHIPRKVLS